MLNQIEMKRNCIILLITVFVNAVYGQVSKFEYNGRNNPTITKEKLVKATFISDIMPEFWRYASLTSGDRLVMQRLINMQSSEHGRYLFPQVSYYGTVENYNRVIEYVSIVIVAKYHGKQVTAESYTSTLTREQ